jgi:hypothetical protein
MYPDTQNLNLLGEASLAKFWNKLLFLCDQAVVMRDAKTYKIAQPANAQFQVLDFELLN